MSFNVDMFYLAMTAGILGECNSQVVVAIDSYSKVKMLVHLHIPEIHPLHLLPTFKHSYKLCLTSGGAHSSLHFGFPTDRSTSQFKDKTH